MNYNSILTSLYYLLIYADGDVNQKEIASIKQMIRTERIDQEEYNRQVELLNGRDKSVLLSECVEGLRTLSHAEQVRIIAWLCVVANADGFMERGEWQLIYKIYHKELNLPLNEIFAVQKELTRLMWEHKMQAIL